MTYIAEAFLAGSGPLSKWNYEEKNGQMQRAELANASC